MDIDEGPSFDWVESSAVSEINANFENTFCHNPEDSKLQITRFYEIVEENGGDRERCCVHEGPLVFPEDINKAVVQPDLCQIYAIYQRHTHSRLYITRELFEQLITAYAIFARIWDFILPYHFQVRESDIGNAPFRFRQLKSITPGTPRIASFECAYSFRYVILNQRKGQKDGNPDYDPWSIRQTAVYQQYYSEDGKTTFVLITPSDTAKDWLEETILRCQERQRPLNAFNLHRILISTLHENWRLYIRGLEHLLKGQSDRVTLAKVQSETEALSPLPDLVVNFVDRQRLKMIEDKILDLVIIFESLSNTIDQLQRQCRSHCLGPLCGNCTCPLTIYELEEQIHETQVNLRKANILHKRVKGTAKLLSDLLEYENAQIAHHNEKSLNGLVQESRDENSKMRLLTERSTRDATAVKILTVITLIYLPMTVVANFFSTQLIQVDNEGRISLISEFWWFVVVSVPLTIGTFLLWQYWLSASIRKQERDQKLGCSHEASMNNEQWGNSRIKTSLQWMRGKFDLLRNRQQGGAAADMP